MATSVVANFSRRNVSPGCRGAQVDGLSQIECMHAGCHCFASQRARADLERADDARAAAAKIDYTNMETAKANASHVKPDADSDPDPEPSTADECPTPRVIYADPGSPDFERQDLKRLLETLGFGPERVVHASWGPV